MISFHEKLRLQSRVLFSVTITSLTSVPLLLQLEVYTFFEIFCSICHCTLIYFVTVITMVITLTNQICFHAVLCMSYVCISVSNKISDSVVVCVLLCTHIFLNEDVLRTCMKFSSKFHSRSCNKGCEI
jgi:hypothetical protein